MLAELDSNDYRESNGLLMNLRRNLMRWNTADIEVDGQNTTTAVARVPANQLYIRNWPCTPYTGSRNRSEHYKALYIFLFVRHRVCNDGSIFYRHNMNRPITHGVFLKSHIQKKCSKNGFMFRYGCHHVWLNLVTIRFFFLKALIKKLLLDA